MKDVAMFECILKFVFSVMWLLGLSTACGLSLHGCSAMRARHLWFFTKENCSSHSTQDKRQQAQIKHMEFHLIAKRHFFAVRVVKHSNRLPKDVAEYPSVEIL